MALVAKCALELQLMKIYGPDSRDVTNEQKSFQLSNIHNAVDNLSNKKN